MNSKLFFPFLLCFLVLQTKCFAQPESTSQEVCSILGVVIANSKALLKGDVLVRESTILDATIAEQGVLPMGVLAKEVAYSRVIFDHGEKKYAVFRVQRSSLNNFDTRTENEKTDIRGTCFDGEKLIFFNRDGRTWNENRKQYPEDEFEFLRKIGFRDYRTFWFASGSPKSIDEKGMATVFSRKQGRRFHSNRKIGKNKLEIKFKQSNVKVLGEKLDLCVIYQFDTRNSLPLSTEKYFASKDSPKMPMWSRAIGWEEVDDVFVPSKGSHHDLDSIRVGGKEYDGLCDTEYKFHWFSVNQEIENKEFFDGTHLKNDQAVLDIVDPKKTGASSFIKEPLPGAPQDKAAKDDLE